MAVMGAVAVLVTNCKTLKMTKWMAVRVLYDRDTSTYTHTQQASGRCVLLENFSSLIHFYDDH